MPRLQVTFGYYPDDDEVSSEDVSLRSLEGLSEIVDKIEKHYGVSKDWIYPSEGRIFSLPKTHVLIHENADCLDHLEFLIWCISFFVGMRLTTTEAGFLDATPIRPGRLTDFRLSNCTLATRSRWRNPSGGSSLNCNVAAGLLKQQSTPCSFRSTHVIFNLSDLPTSISP